ncbi:acetyltransferase [Microbacterium aerolatum]|uniref:Acetyltransferase n=1 Tax=Microbacterium aerolatum TaxID=153731 RepID=A0A511AHP1_9MICO|nr:acetyltransferase [Microbacterium aerolatum]GEK86231.1 acetyltransferase [Microbacterium aerolatum]GGB16300.1 acetyltransferase [Microbacterium aerolatum]
MADDILVVGAGGFGRETLDVIESINATRRAPLWNVLGIVDDDPEPVQRARLSERGYTWLGSGDEVTRMFGAVSYTLAIGKPQIRAKLATRFEAAGWLPVSLIHPSANVGSYARIGSGTVVCGGAQISTNTRLGRYVHLNPGAIVGHDSVLDDFVSVNPGAIISGEVSIGSGALIGAGAVALQGLKIGADAVVGASACVTRDISPRSTVKGVPAR